MAKGDIYEHQFYFGVLHDRPEVVVPKRRAWWKRLLRIGREVPK